MFKEQHFSFGFTLVQSFTLICLLKPEDGTFISLDNKSTLWHITLLLLLICSISLCSKEHKAMGGEYMVSDLIQPGASQ